MGATIKAALTILRNMYLFNPYFREKDDAFCESHILSSIQGVKLPVARAQKAGLARWVV